MKPPRPSRRGARPPGRRSSALVVGFLLGLPCPLPVHSQEEKEEPAFLRIEIDEGALLDQALYADSRDACAPAALANALRQGTPAQRTSWTKLAGRDDTTRFRYLIDRWFRTPNSKPYPRKKRLSFDGVLEEDLAAATNEMLGDFELPPLTAGYLDREEGESSRDFVTRIHGKMLTSIERILETIRPMRAPLSRRSK